MPKDLRSFIADLETKSPEDVARVRKPIAPRYEITALLTQLERSKRFPLLFCENVEGSEAPVATDVALRLGRSSPVSSGASPDVRPDRP